MTRVELCRIEYTGFFAGDRGNMARVPPAAPVLPRHLQGIVAVDVRVRPRDAGPRYSRSTPDCDVPGDRLRPGLIVDFYA